MAPAVEPRVLDAARECCERHGITKLSIDDIAARSGVSRATIYRLYPGGKDVVLEALRVRELEEFFAVLRDQVEGADSLDDLLVRAVVAATRELRADDHLALMLAAEPGAVLGQLTVEGLPRIIRFATAFLVPLTEPYLARPEALAVVGHVLARLTISYFLSPSDTIDLGDEAAARPFIATVLQPFVDGRQTVPL